MRTRSDERFKKKVKKQFRNLNFSLKTSIILKKFKNKGKIILLFLMKKKQIALLSILLDIK